MARHRGERFFTAARYLSRDVEKPEIHWRVEKAFELATEYGVNWLFFRIAISTQFHCEPWRLREWSIRDLISAHATLDAIDEVESWKAEQAERSKF